MVVSVKPFGCLPSTQSDGVQAKVVADTPASIFLSVETSGDGEVNVKSRLQMKLHEARGLAADELRTVLRQGGVSLAEVRAYAGQSAALRRPLQRLPDVAIGTAANFVRKVLGRRPR
jgi:predicted nucleotide-binding protein (sugar kinase/HSP70/actin superfamily)